VFAPSRMRFINARTRSVPSEHRSISNDDHYRNGVLLDLTLSRK
jgi:hypothetical protein